MRFIWISARKDLLRLRRDPTTLVVWLGIPLLVALLLTLIFGRGDARPNGKLLIADEDGGLGSMLLTGAFSQGPLGKMIAVEKVDRLEGRRRLDKGDAAALLVIPHGFTNAVLENHSAKLELVRNPALTIVPGMIEETVSMMAEAGFYVQAVAGDQLRSMTSPGVPSDTQVAESAVAMNRLIGRFQKYLAPPLIRLETKVITTEFDKPGAFATLLFPSMLYMAVFFVAGALATDIWRERTAGGLRRVLTTPASLGAFLAGKLLAAALVIAATGAFGLVLAHYLIGLPVANFGLAILWIAVTGCGLYVIILLLQSAASNERVAALLSNFFMLPLAMLGGSFFPFETMPKGLAMVGRLTPNGWSLVHLKSILAGSAEWPALAAVAAFLVAGWLIGMWRIRRTAC